MELLFILSQILASIAIVFDLLSFQFKKRKYMILCFITSSICLSIHYFLLFKILTGFFFIGSVFRFITSYFSTNKKFMYLFLLYNFVILLLMFKEYTDLISFIALNLIVIGVFQNKGKKLRLIMMSGTSFMLLYNILIFTPVGIIVEFLFLSSNIIGYIRYYKRNNFKLIKE